MGSDIHAFFLVFGTFLYESVGITYAGQPGATFEVFQFGFRTPQFAVDDYDALIDELSRFGRYQFLVIIGIKVVYFNEFVDKIFSPLLVGSLYIDVGNGSRVRSAGNAQCRQISFCHLKRRGDCDIDGFVEYRFGIGT